MNDDRRSLGARLRKAREYLGLSQDEVARVVGLPRPAVSLIESGRRKVEAFELKKLAALYQRPLADFTGDVQAETTGAGTLQYLARATARLTAADRAELVQFAEFLDAKRARERGDSA